MKRPGKFITNTTFAICGTSLLLSSCDGYFVDDDMINISQQSEIGEAAININFSKNEQEYIAFLNKLSYEIIQDPQVAQKFAKDPQKFIERYGYNEKIDLDENMLRYVLTLGDPDLNAAIKQNDIDKIIHIMKDKNLLTNGYNKVKLSPEEISKIKRFYGVKQSNDSNKVSDIDNTQSLVAVFVALVYIFVGVVEDIVAGYNVGVGLNVYAYAALKTKVKVWSESPNVFEKSVKAAAIAQNLSLKAISLKNPSYNIYILADKYMEDFSKELVNGLEKEIPESLQGLSKDELQNIIKYNMFLKSNDNNIKK